VELSVPVSEMRASISTSDGIGRARWDRCGGIISISADFEVDDGGGSDRLL